MNQKKPLVLLNDNKIKKVLRIKDVIKVVEDGFRKKGLGLVSLPPKTGPKLPEGAFADAMSVSVFEGGVLGLRLQTYGVKWLSSFSENLKKNLPVLKEQIKKIKSDLE